MSEEKHLPCRICDASRVLIDGIFCNTCFDMVEQIRAYYGEYEGFQVKVTTTERKVNGLRRIR